MNAKKELEQRIFATFSEGIPATVEAVSEILKDYIILKENDDQRSDLHRRITYYLGAKKIDGLSERTLKNYKYNLELFAGRVTKSAAKIVELQSASNDVMDALTELAGIVAGGGENNG